LVFNITNIDSKVFNVNKILVGLLLILSGTTKAALIQLDEDPLYVSYQIDSGGYLYAMGSGRGVGFNVNKTFDVSSIGINLAARNSNVLKPLYEFEIYSSTDGHDVGDLLTNVEFYLTQTGEGWVDAAINYKFIEGNSYVVNFSRTDDRHLGVDLATIFSLDTGLPINYGRLTAKEGFQGATPDARNPLNPLVRFQAFDVSEPSSVLFVMVLLCLLRRNAVE
jgi:hypothetical protein